MRIAFDQRPGPRLQTKSRTASASVVDDAPGGYQYIVPSIAAAEWSTLFDRIVEHLGSLSSTIASAALKTGLHRAAKLWSRPKIEVDRPSVGHGDGTR